MKRQALYLAAFLIVSILSYCGIGGSGSTAIAQSGPTPGVHAFKMGPATSPITLSTTYTTIASEGFPSPVNNLAQVGTLRWQAVLEIRAPATPSTITYEFVVGVGTTVTCSGGAGTVYTQTGYIQSTALQAGATQDVPIDGWIGPPGGQSLFPTSPATKDNILVCASTPSGGSGSTTITHPQITTSTKTLTNVGTAWLFDLTSYPYPASALTFTGNSPGIQSCFIFNSPSRRRSR